MSIVVQQAGRNVVVPTSLKNRQLLQPSNVRVLSPSQIITEESTDPSTLLLEVTEKKSWFFRTEFLKCNNLIWLIIGIALALAIIAVTVTVTVFRCRQAQADAQATTLQAGRYVSEACTTSTQCLENALCYSGFCQCVPDFYYSQDIGQCLKVKTYGLFCADSRECDYNRNLTCYNGVCSCPSNYIWANYYNDYECLRQRSIGENCNSTSDCVSTSYCTFTGVDYRCQCPFGYYVESNTGTCQQQKLYFQRCYSYFNECTSNFICTGRYNDGTTLCLCRSDYYFDSTTYSCLAKKSYGGSCKNNTHCVSNVNLFCLSNLCACLSTQFWNGTFCVNYTMYSQPCSASAPCNPLDSFLQCTVPPGSASSQTVCNCRTGSFYDEYNSRCVALRIPTQNCTDTSQCVTNAVCLAEPTYQTGSTCGCVQGYYYSAASGSCVPMGGFGTVCANVPCNQYLGLYCFNGASACACKPDYFWDSTLSMCRLTYVYQEPCTLGPPNTCRDSRYLVCSGSTPYQCVCATGKPTYHTATGMCY